MKIKSLNGLRFVVAFGIFLHHFDMFLNKGIPGFDEGFDFFFELFVGVGFFFVLSGFLITYGYQEKLQAKKIKSTTFLFYRIARMWPLHIVTLFLIIFANSAMSSMISKKFLANFFLLQSLVPNESYAFSFNAVAWSLSTELFFYVAFCFLVTLSSKRLKQIFVLLLGVIIFHQLLLGWRPWIYYINPGFRLIDFLAGMLLCRVMFKWKDKIDLSTTKATILEALAFIILTIFILIAFSSNISIIYRYDLYYLLPIVFLVGIFSFDKGYLSKVFSLKIFQFLGDISFAFYLVHQLILHKIMERFLPQITSVTILVFYGSIAFIISLVLSIILYYTIENPVYKILRASWDKYQLRKG